MSKIDIVIEVLFILLIVYVGLALFLRSFSCPGPAPSVLDLAHLGLSLPLHSTSRLGPLLSLSGVARLDPTPSALDFVH